MVRYDVMRCDIFKCDIVKMDLKVTFGLIWHETMQHTTHVSTHNMTD